MPVAPARKAGTWKMAYADFLTALMAFFLLMWLISGVSADDRAEIADYFHNRTPDAATDAVCLFCQHDAGACRNKRRIFAERAEHAIRCRGAGLY